MPRTESQRLVLSYMRGKLTSLSLSAEEILRTLDELVQREDLEFLQQLDSHTFEYRLTDQGRSDDDDDSWPELEPVEPPPPPRPGGRHLSLSPQPDLTSEEKS